MNKKLLLIGILLILGAQLVVALGVSPGKVALDFKPNLETTFNLVIINNDQKELIVALNAEGDLKDYISFDQKEIKISPNEGSKTITYKVKLPQELNKPGEHNTKIIIREIKSAENKVVNVGATLAVASILQINVPYDGKYAEANLFAIESNQGEETLFVVEVNNLGEENINTAIASINIFDNEKKIATVVTDQKSINKGNKRELIARWVAEHPGSFEAKAKVNYDGKVIEAKTRFNVGGFFLKLIDISVKNFKLGGIAKFNILLENIASEKIKEAFAKMNLNDEKGKAIMNIESQRTPFQPQERKEQQAYWDTENIEKGEYQGKIILNADGKIWENPMTMNVNENSIETKIGPATGMVISSPTNEESYFDTKFIIVLLLVLIGINIGWFIYIKKIR